VAARFWVGGAGTWDGSTTTHWAASSGGASGASAPTATDTVTFDANSGLGSGGTVTVAATAACGGCTIGGINSKTVVFSFSGSPTWSAGTYSFQGNAQTTPILFQSSALGTRRTLTINGTHGTHANLHFQDMDIAGTAGALTGTLIGDCLGNGAGITFTPSATQTATATTSFSWSDSTKWTSRVPLPQDDVVVSGAFSASQTITVDMPRIGRDIDLSAATGAPKFQWAFLASLSSYGSVKMAANVIPSGSTTQWTLFGRSSHTITSNGTSWGASGTTSRINIGGFGGTYSLADDMLFEANGSPSLLAVLRGTFSTNNHNIATGQFNVSTGAVANLGTSTITINQQGGGGGFSFPSGAGISAASASLVFSLTGAGTVTFAGGGQTFGSLTYAGASGRQLTITGANTFGSLILTTTTARTVQFPANTTQTVTNVLMLTGATGQLLSLVSSAPGTRWTLNIPAIAEANYVSLTDSVASPGAGAMNSTDGGNNVGWSFVSTPSSGTSQAQVIVPRGSSIALGWRWYLARSADLSLIDELKTAHGRGIKPKLNGAESAAFTVNTLDSVASKIVPISTCVLCYRNGTCVWSGPVWTLDETIADGSEDVSVTCAGWYELLNHRILKTGSSAPASMPTTTATSMAYAAVDQTFIIMDLLNRTNAEQATGITPGLQPNTLPNGSRNQSYQQFQNIGQAITQMINIENAPDFHVDPLLRTLNLYHSQVKVDAQVYGRGQDRKNAQWGYGVEAATNITRLQRTLDGSALVNQLTATGNYNTAGLGGDPGSQAQYGLFESNESLPTVVSPTLLAAYAQAEVNVRAQPMAIYSFDQMAYSFRAAAAGISQQAFQPFVDFDIGDFGYLNASYGRMQLQEAPVRIFAFDVDIDDEGNEHVKNFQTQYSATS